MAVTLDSVATQTRDTGSGVGTYTANVFAGATLTFPHTVSAGSNRLLGVSCRAGDGVSGVTYGGVDLTKWTGKGRDGGNSIRIFYLVAPTVGTANVVLTCGGSGNAASAGSASFFGVDQTTPFANGVDYAASGTGVTVTTVSGDMASDCCYGPTTTRTVADGGTLIASWLIFDDAPVFAHCLAATGTSTALSWSGAADDGNALSFGFAIKQAAGGGTATNGMWLFS